MIPSIPRINCSDFMVYNIFEWPPFRVCACSILFVLNNRFSVVIDYCVCVCARVRACAFMVLCIRSTLNGSTSFEESVLARPQCLSPHDINHQPTEEGTPHFDCIRLRVMAVVSLTRSINEQTMDQASSYSDVCVHTQNHSHVRS